MRRLRPFQNVHCLICVCLRAIKALQLKIKIISHETFCHRLAVFALLWHDVLPLHGVLSSVRRWRRTTTIVERLLLLVGWQTTVHGAIALCVSTLDRLLLLIVLRLARSINTSITTLIAVLTLYIMGVSNMQAFALPLIVGVICGAYSSVCLAGSMWRLMHHKAKTVADLKRK